ncbi:hypothetical protein CH75_05745 [Dyella jiangningensis]|nr:hypothetical protein CH75_05745 [Dyella jiangningensis]
MGRKAIKRGRVIEVSAGVLIWAIRIHTLKPMPNCWREVCSVKKWGRVLFRSPETQADHKKKHSDPFIRTLLFVGIPGIWFAYGKGVANGQYAYAAFILLLFLLILMRLVGHARRLRE